MLRVCERFGQNPLVWPNEWNEVQEAYLIGYEVLRSHEEARAKEAMAELGAMLARSARKD